ncbi:Hypothetical protein FKW44_024073, partial [Caligus rogercresseyi]
STKNVETPSKIRKSRINKGSSESLLMSSRTRSGSNPKRLASELVSPSTRSESSPR